MIENTTFYYYLLDKYKIELQTVLMIEETSEYYDLDDDDKEELMERLTNGD